MQAGIFLEQTCEKESVIHPSCGHPDSTQQFRGTQTSRHSLFGDQALPKGMLGHDTNNHLMQFRIIYNSLQMTWNLSPLKSCLHVSQLCKMDYRIVTWSIWWVMQWQRLYLTLLLVTSVQRPAQLSVPLTTAQERQLYPSAQASVKSLIYTCLPSSNRNRFA